MKTKRLLTFFLALLLHTSWAQVSSYAEAIAKADALMRAGEYQQALRNYLAAEAFDPSKHRQVAVKLQRLFDRVDGERKRAAESEAAAVAALKLAQEQQAKNQRIVNALFFQHGLALTQKLTSDGLMYGFINEEGEVTIPHRYDHATAFFRDGFARVEIELTEARIVQKFKNDEKEHGPPLETGKYLLDTTGQQYLLAHSWAELKAATRALDLSKQDRARLDSLESGTQLQLLFLQDNRLKSLPEQLLDLKELKLLQLAGNELTALPANIGELEALLMLELSDNALEELPASLVKLERLEGLSMVENNLKTLPSDIGNLKALRHLYLSANHLSALPGSIASLENLEQLYLTDNELTAFPKTLYQLKRLKILYLIGNNIPQAELEAARKAMPWCTIF